MDLNELLKNPDQIKTLISVLQTLVDSTENQVDHTEEEKPTVKKTRAKTKNTTVSSKKNKKKNTDSRENRFLDMPEKNLHKEDVEIDRKLHKLPPTPRSRRFQSMKVMCRVCGRNETINPSYMTTERDRYKCNKCSGAAG